MCGLQYRALGACPRIDKDELEESGRGVARLFGRKDDGAGLFAAGAEEAIQKLDWIEIHRRAFRLRLEGTVELQDIVRRAQQRPLALNFLQAA